MNELALARALHVLGVVLWIGGVAMVTTVLLPAVQRYVNPGEKVEFFEQLESRFAAQARWTTALVGVTGFWLTGRSPIEPDAIQVAGVRDQQLCLRRPVDLAAHA